MPRRRVYEVADELSTSTKLVGAAAVVSAAQSLGFPVANHLSLLEEPQVEQLRQYFDAQKKKSTAGSAPSPVQEHVHDAKSKRGRTKTDSAELMELAASFKVFVDTCTLMHERAEGFLNGPVAEALSANGSKLIVPTRAIQELEKHSRSTERPKKRSAEKGLRAIAGLKNRGLLDIRGEKSDDFADQVFLTVFMRHRMKYNLCLITQDRALATEIMDLGASKAVRTRKSIRAFRLGKDGTLKDWARKSSSNREGAPNPSAKESPVNKKPPKFSLCTGTPSRASSDSLGIRKVPGLRDRVRTSGGATLRLETSIGSGGEGEIYLASSGNVCKVYKPEKLTRGVQAKLELMVANQLDIKGVCWPRELVYSDSGVVVGYAMERAAGKSLASTVFAPKPVFLSQFGAWTRVNLVELCISVVERIQALHDANVLVGDLNGSNILLASDRDVYLVDTDSYQINDFPCPVGMVNYTAPEIQGRDFKTFLRTREHEHFALASLLFMMLVPGKPPYSQQGGADPASNIRKRDFSYPLGKESNKKAPPGPWRFIWSHMPYKTKEAFYNCFKQGKRISPEEWLDVLRRYRNDAEKGYVSSDLFPEGYKIVEPVTVTCSACGRKYEDSRPAVQEILAVGRSLLCDDCRQGNLGASQRSNSVEFRCSSCGGSFSVPENKAQSVRRHPEPLCRTCLGQLIAQREEESRTGTLLYCSDCHQQFLFSVAEQRFFAEKGFTQPKRCRNCRAARRGRPSGSQGYSGPDPVDSLLSGLKRFWDDLWR